MVMPGGLVSASSEIGCEVKTVMGIAEGVVSRLAELLLSPV
jgi:hypothetical protein